jgi:hypothetical protein
MPDRERLLTAADDLALRIDLADQLDAALDSDAEQPGAGVLPLPSADAVVAFLSLATASPNAPASTAAPWTSPRPATPPVCAAPGRNLRTWRSTPR